MPKSKIEQERQRLNKLRRQHPEDVNLDMRVTIIRKLLRKAAAEPDNKVVRKLLAQQTRELAEYMQTERAKVVALR